MIITTSGTLMRMSMEGISTMGRNTQGVRLIHTREDDSVATVCRTDKTEEEELESLEDVALISESDALSDDVTDPVIEESEESGLVDSDTDSDNE